MTFATNSCRLARGACLALAAAAVLLAAGCSKKEEPASAAAPAPAHAPAAPAPATPPAAPPARPPAPAAAPQAESTDSSEKLHAYITCYNSLDSSAHRTLSRYASWVKNMETGPTGKEMVVYGLYSIDTDGIARCQKTITAAAAEKPALAALDAAASDWIAALHTLNGTVSDAYTYYDRENYKDDHFAKGKALHPALVSQGKAFRQASERFSDELEAENDKRLAAQLAEVERTEGRKITYWHMSLMATAKQLVRILDEENFSVEEAAKRLAAYESTTDEAMKYGTANKSELPTSWFTLEHAAEDYRKAAKQRLRRVRDKVPYNEGEKMMLKPGSAWMVEGSTEQLTKAYNELIETSNRLH